MGQVHVQVTLTNYREAVLARLGQLDPTQVHRYETEALVDTGTISPEDKELFCYVDTPEEGFEILKEGLTKYHLQPQHLPTPEPEKEDGKDQGEAPEIAKTRG